MEKGQVSRSNLKTSTGVSFTLHIISLILHIFSQESPPIALTKLWNDKSSHFFVQNSTVEQQKLKNITQSVHFFALTLNSLKFMRLDGHF